MFKWLRSVVRPNRVAYVTPSVKPSSDKDLRRLAEELDLGLEGDAPMDEVRKALTKRLTRTTEPKSITQKGQRS